MSRVDVAVDNNGMKEFNVSHAFAMQLGGKNEIKDKKKERVRPESTCEDAIANQESRPSRDCHHRSELEIEQ